jgi:RNA-binding protein YhbY
MSTIQATLQIGKNGLTPAILEIIKARFKAYRDIKIILLKSAGHNREKAKEIADKIHAELGNKYTYKIIGFTIFLKKWRKEINDL